MESKRKRGVNFTHEECLALAHEVSARGKVIHGEFSASITHALKTRAWEMVAEAVNAMSPCTRSVENVKDKWTDMRRRTKAKVCANKRATNQTGAEPPNLVPMTDVDLLVETQLGNASIHGVGGIDTMEDCESIPKSCPATAAAGSCLPKMRPTTSDRHESEPSLPSTSKHVQPQSPMSRPASPEIPHSQNFNFHMPDFNLEETDSIIPPVQPSPQPTPKQLPGAAKKIKASLQAQIVKITKEENIIRKDLLIEIKKSNALQEKLIAQKEQFISMKREEYVAKALRHAEIMDLQVQHNSLLKELLARK